MYKRIIALLCLAVAGLAVSARAQAQDQAAMDDQMAMAQAMQPMFQTIMQNMQDKGIDPRQFFQQMQNGTDPAEMEKQLLDQGLIDQKTIDQAADVQTIQSRSLKRQLDATDEAVENTVAVDSEGDESIGGGERNAARRAVWAEWEWAGS